MIRRWGVLLLVLFPATLLAEVTLPEVKRDGMEARLVLQVRPQAATPGLAEVVCTVTVEGPQGMEVHPAQLGETVAAWEANSKRFSRREGDRLLLTEVLDLKQTKPGQQPLPAIKVRFRASPEQTWEEAEWTDLLKPRDVLRPEITLPTPSPTPVWLWPVILGGSGLVLALAAFVGVRLLARPKPPPPPTPEQWASNELDRLEEQAGQQGSEWYHTRLSYVVRRFLEEKYGLKAPRQTTAEFLASARQAAQLSDEQRELLQKLLERCDLAKFAPVTVSAEDCRQATELARRLVAQPGQQA